MRRRRPERGPRDRPARCGRPRHRESPSPCSRRSISSRTAGRSWRAAKAPLPVVRATGPRLRSSDPAVIRREEGADRTPHERLLDLPDAAVEVEVNERQRVQEDDGREREAYRRDHPRQAVDQDRRAEDPDADEEWVRAHGAEKLLCAGAAGRLAVLLLSVLSLAVLSKIQQPDDDEILDEVPTEHSERSQVAVLHPEVRMEQQDA